MTKREFATRLLFWLLPWPISKILPRSLRIYYFGPSGGPPPGWYDYWGIPQWFWPDVPPYDDFIEDPPVEPPPWWPPEAPPYDDFIEDPPVEPPPFFPVDPYNPPSPDQFPLFSDYSYNCYGHAVPGNGPGYLDILSGPHNPSDPYTPGPGPNVPFHGNLYFPFFDNTFWAAAGGISWNAALKRWIGNGIDVTLSAIGTWATGFRASWIYFDWTGTDIFWIHLNDTDGNIIATVNNPGNKVYINITFQGYDIDTITLDGDTIQIIDIHFI